MCRAIRETETHDDVVCVPVTCLRWSSESVWGVNVCCAPSGLLTTVPPSAGGPLGRGRMVKPKDPPLASDKSDPYMPVSSETQQESAGKPWNDCPVEEMSSCFQLPGKHSTLHERLHRHNMSLNSYSGAPFQTLANRRHKWSCEKLTMYSPANYQYKPLLLMPMMIPYRILCRYVKLFKRYWSLWQNSKW